VDNLMVTLLMMLRLCGHKRNVDSFPTQRSSDPAAGSAPEETPADAADAAPEEAASAAGAPRAELDGVLRRLERSGDDLEYRDLRSEEHTSELQSRENLVCRLLLE